MQLYAADDGRGDARNMLSHISTSSNKLVENSCIWLVDLFEPEISDCGLDDRDLIS